MKAKKVVELTKRIALIILLTVMPFLIIRWLWLTIVRYWKLIASTFFVSGGSVFIYFYFKNYTFKVIYLKLKKLIYKDKISLETQPDRLVNEGEELRNQNILIVGISMIFVGFYLLYKFLI